MEFIEVKSADWRYSRGDAKFILDGVHNFRLDEPQIVIIDGGQRVFIGKVFEYHVTSEGTVVFFKLLNQDMSEKDIKAVLRVYSLLRGSRPIPDYGTSSGDSDMAGMDGATAMAFGFDSDPEEIARRAHRNPPRYPQSIADAIGYGDD